MHKSDDLTNQDYLTAGALLTDVGVPEPRIIVTSARQMAQDRREKPATLNPAAVVSQGFPKACLRPMSWAGKSGTRIRTSRRSTVGPAGGVPLVSGANQTGSSLLVKELYRGGRAPVPARG